jgi:hypothetical protein
VSVDLSCTVRGTQRTNEYKRTLGMMVMRLWSSQYQGQRVNIARRVSWGRSAKWTYSSNPCCEVPLDTSGVRVGFDALCPNRGRIDLGATVARRRVDPEYKFLLARMLKVGTDVLSLFVHRS